VFINKTLMQYEANQPQQQDPGKYIRPFFTECTLLACMYLPGSCGWAHGGVGLLCTRHMLMRCKWQLTADALSRSAQQQSDTQPRHHRKYCFDGDEPHQAWYGSWNHIRPGMVHTHQANGSYDAALSLEVTCNSLTLRSIQHQLSILMWYCNGVSELLVALGHTR